MEIVSNIQVQSADQIALWEDVLYQYFWYNFTIISFVVFSGNKVLSNGNIGSIVKLANKFSTVTLNDVETVKLLSDVSSSLDFQGERFKLDLCNQNGGHNELVVEEWMTEEKFVVSKYFRDARKQTRSKYVFLANENGVAFIDHLRNKLLDTKYVSVAFINIHGERRIYEASWACDYISVNSSNSTEFNGIWNDCTSDLMGRKMLVFHWAWGDPRMLALGKYLNMSLIYLPTRPNCLYSNTRLTISAIRNVTTQIVRREKVMYYIGVVTPDYDTPKPYQPDLFVATSVFVIFVAIAIAALSQKTVDLLFETFFGVTFTDGCIVLSKKENFFVSSFSILWVVVSVILCFSVISKMTEKTVEQVYPSNTEELVNQNYTIYAGGNIYDKMKKSVLGLYTSELENTSSSYYNDLVVKRTIPTKHDFEKNRRSHWVCLYLATEQPKTACMFWKSYGFYYRLEHFTSLDGKSQLHEIEADTAPLLSGIDVGQYQVLYERVNKFAGSILNGDFYIDSDYPGTVEEHMVLYKKLKNRGENSVQKDAISIDVFGLKSLEWLFKIYGVIIAVACVIFCCEKMRIV